MDDKKIVNLFEKLQLDTLPQEEQERLFVRMDAVIYQKVLNKILALLSTPDRAEALKLLEQDKEEELLSFLRGKIADLDGVVANEIASFNQEASDFMDQVKVE